MSEELIRLSDLTVTFEDGETILDHINLYIRNKEFLTLLGPSGCGKTTTLRIIGGFLTPTSGDVFFNGKRINDVPPYERKINTVFQKYALFPHLDVYDNIAFGLRPVSYTHLLLILFVVVLLAVLLKNADEPTPGTDGEQTVSASEVRTNEDRVAYLAQFGWEVSAEPVQTQEVRIPTDPSDVFERYNDLQLAQGFDLHNYAGKTCLLYTSRCV